MSGARTRTEVDIPVTILLNWQRASYPHGVVTRGFPYTPRMRMCLRLVCLAALFLGAPLPASGQSVLAGNWNSLRTFEDDQDRGPGPDLGDYLGLPINDAARSPTAGTRRA